MKKKKKTCRIFILSKIKREFKKSSILKRQWLISTELERIIKTEKKITKILAINQQQKIMQKLLIKFLFQAI